MKVFKYFPPYKADGRTNFPETKQRSGVYLIKENGKLTYIGYSAADLYKTLYRHFQHWSDKEYRGGKVVPAQYRVSYKTRMNRHRYTVRVVLCTPAQAERLEKALIKKHNPRDNAMKYEQYQLSYQDKRDHQVYDQQPVEDEYPF